MAQVLMQLLQVCPQRFVNERASYGWTPLHQLCNNADNFNQRHGMIIILAQAGADLDLGKGQHDTTPLMIAASTGHYDGVTALLLCGADPRRPNMEGTTAMDVAHRCSSDVAWALSNVGAVLGKGTTGTGRLISALDDPLSGLA